MSFRLNGAYHSNRSNGSIILKLLAVLAGLFILTGVMGLTSNDKQPEANSLITTSIDLPGHAAQKPRKNIQQSVGAIPLAGTTARTISAPLTTVAKQKTPTADFAAMTPGEPLAGIPEVAASYVVPAKRYMDEWTVSKGDTMSSIFSHFNIHSELHDLMQLDETKKTLSNIRPGDVIKFDIGSSGLDMLVYDMETTKQLVVEKIDNQFSASIKKRETQINEIHAEGVIEDSLFASASRAGLSDNLIMQLAEIFGYDIDFALDMRVGDSFKMIYEDVYLEGQKIDGGKIIAAEFINQGKTFQAVRYTDPDDLVQYFSPDGRNMKKTFLRTPVNFTRISSRFNPRRKHPILHKIRAHKGVDYAAPTGTPIKAAGNGKIVHRGTKGGYGKAVIIQHGNKYSTLYAHMNNYRKGQRVGSSVKQGDVIGYVGKTGSATGPHLHYEFHVYGVHKNPLKVTLPKAEPLPSRLMSDFEDKASPYLSWLGSLNRVATVASDTAD